MSADKDELVEYQNKHAYGKVMQFRSYDSGDASVDQVVDVELVDWLGGNIEIAFDMKERGNRTYVKLRASDLRRFLRQCEN